MSRYMSRYMSASAGRPALGIYTKSSTKRGLTLTFFGGAGAPAKKPFLVACGPMIGPRK